MNEEKTLRKMNRKKSKKIKVKVLKEDNGYSTSFELNGMTIFATGDTLKDFKTDLSSALELAFDGEYTLDDCIIEYDLESFFHFYSVINAKALSERIGMNQSLLAQYIKGIKKPSATQKERINTAIRELGQELSEVSIILEK